MKHDMPDCYVHCEHGMFNVDKGWGCSACMHAEIARLKARVKELEAVVEAITGEGMPVEDCDCAVCLALIALAGDGDHTTTGTAKECEPEDY